MKEKLIHGSRQFRMSVHVTKLSSLNNLVLYSHWHEELELLFMIKGTAKFHVGQEKLVVQSGEAVFIQPNMLHSAIRVDQEEIIFCAVLVHFNFLSSLENDQIQQQYVFPLFLDNRRYPLLIGRELEEKLRLIPLLEEVRDLYQQETHGYEMLIKARLFEVLYRLEKCAAEHPQAGLTGQSRGGNSSMLAKKRWPTSSRTTISGSRSRIWRSRST